MTDYWILTDVNNQVWRTFVDVFNSEEQIIPVERRILEPNWVNVKPDRWWRPVHEPWQRVRNGMIQRWQGFTQGWMDFGETLDRRHVVNCRKGPGGSWA